MTENIEIIEEILRPHFQKTLNIVIDNQIYKSGKFVVFQTSQLLNYFFLEFHIQTDKKIEVVKIPYPFDVDNYEDEGLIYFDYRINTMTKNKKITQRLQDFAKTQEGSTQNKFYNKIIELEFV